MKKKAKQNKTKKTKKINLFYYTLFTSLFASHILVVFVFFWMFLATIHISQKNSFDMI